MEKIVVTGGTGYIGRNVVRQLVGEGNRVGIIVRPSSDLSELSDLKNVIEIFKFNENTDKMLTFFKEFKPDGIIHLAASFIGAHETNQVAKMIESNVAFGACVIECASKAGVKRFVNAGTHHQYYNLEDYNPVSFYAATKQAFEDIARFYSEAEGMSILNVILMSTYGPLDPRNKLISLFNKLVSTNEHYNMAQGVEEVGLLYIDDVVKAFLLGLKKTSQVKSGFFGHVVAKPTRIYTMREVVDIYEQVAGKKLNILWSGREYGNREMLKVWAAAEDIFQGQELVNLRDGLQKIFELEGIKYGN